MVSSGPLPYNPRMQNFVAELRRRNVLRVAATYALIAANRELIADLGQSHGIILSTHILPEVQAVCNRVQIINQGKLVYASDMAGLLQQQDTGRYELVLKQAPALGELNKFALIKQAEQRGDHHFIRSAVIGNARGWRSRRRRWPSATAGCSRCRPGARRRARGSRRRRRAGG